VFSSPIGPRPLGGGPLPATLAEQIELTFANLRRVLDAAGVGAADVMFVRVLVADLADRAEFNAAWMQFFGPEGPARQVTENSLPEGARLLLRFTALEPTAQEN
jgi:enamine deaminase RidA (YjgF/YER057c/UK114 family)